MTDYQFLSADGTVNVILRTDFIAGDVTTGNLTICEKIFVKPDTNHLFVNWQHKNYSVFDFATFATAQNLQLVAIPIGGPEVPAPKVIGKATLSAPVVTPTVISATQINLDWTDVPGATGYVVDRATNVGFTTGVALAIYTGATSAFNNTGLTTATHYWYRVRATATNFIDSAYGNANATTN